MTAVFKVEPVIFISQHSNKKRTAKTSPPDPLGDWSLKRSKTNEISSKENNTDLDTNVCDRVTHLTLNVIIPDNNAERDVVDVDQPLTS